jgi:hypothetical protein
MTFKIGGFASGAGGKKEQPSASCQLDAEAKPRKSLVQVCFPGKGMPLNYYNDQFDLKKGDFVYVDGKQEGLLGRVSEVSYNFKIKISDYRKVIAVVDTDVQGEFCMAGSHFVTFDPAAIPTNKIVTWFRAPAKESEVFVSSTDDFSFRLDDLSGMNVNAAIADRGHDYYMDNRVRYLCIDNGRGFAIVDGSDTYTVEFSYRGGEISQLICDCPCGYTCKHEFAAMLQLRETLEIINKHYCESYERTGYFAAITKGALFTFAVDSKETGSFTL